MDKDKTKSVWTYMISSKNFKFGFIIMVLAVLLSFASIYVTVATVTQTYTWEAEEDDYHVYEPLWLYTAYEPKNNTLSVYYNNGVNHTAEIFIFTEGEYEDPIHNFSLESGATKNMVIQEDAVRIVPYFEKGSLHLEYTIEYYSFPYSLLAIPAMVLTIIGIILVYRSYVDSLGQMIHDLGENVINKGNIDDYTSPVADQGNQEDDNL